MQTLAQSLHRWRVSVNRLLRPYRPANSFVSRPVFCLLLPGTQGSSSVWSAVAFIARWEFTSAKSSRRLLIGGVGSGLRYALTPARSLYFSSSTACVHTLFLLRAPVWKARQLGSEGLPFFSVVRPSLRTCSGRLSEIERRYNKRICPRALPSGYYCLRVLGSSCCGDGSLVLHIPSRFLVPSRLLFSPDFSTRRLPRSSISALPWGGLNRQEQHKYSQWTRALVWLHVCRGCRVLSHHGGALLDFSVHDRFACMSVSGEESLAVILSPRSQHADTAPMSRHVGVSCMCVHRETERERGVCECPCICTYVDAST